MDLWKTLKREVLYSFGRFGMIELHEIELPDGHIIKDWAWLDLPDFIIVLPETDSGEFLVFRQSKYAINGLTLAPVGGYIEKDEDPLTAAHRELEEEMGSIAREMIPLGEYVVDANRGAGKAYLYLARGVQRVETDAVSDELEEQELVSLSRAQLIDALASGEFKTIAGAAAVAMALLKLP